MECSNKYGPSAFLYSCRLLRFQYGCGTSSNCLSCCLESTPAFTVIQYQTIHPVLIQRQSAPVHRRATKRQATICTHTHTYTHTDDLIHNSPVMHVFRLWEETTQTQGERSNSMQTPYRRPQARNRTHVLLAASPQIVSNWAGMRQISIEKTAQKTRHGKPCTPNHLNKPQISLCLLLMRATVAAEWMSGLHFIFFLFF